MTPMLRVAGEERLPGRNAPATSERGAALLMVLVLAAVVGAVGGMLALQGAVDMALAGSYRTGEEALAAAEAGLERAAGELSTMADWSAVLRAPPANATAPFSQPGTLLRAPDGRTFDEGALLAARQAATPAVFGANAPQWRVYAKTSLQGLWPAPLAGPPALIIVFVADDGAEEDGDPGADVNGRVWLHADAYALQGARRQVQALLVRAAPGAVRLHAWSEIRP